MRKIITLLLVCFTLEAKAISESAYIEIVVEAIYIAEGGTKAKRPYGMIRLKTNDKETCRKVCIKYVTMYYADWKAAGRPGNFIDYLANIFAPVVGVNKNTAKLNKNWPRNVKFYVDKQLKKR